MHRILITWCLSSLLFACSANNHQYSAFLQLDFNSVVQQSKGIIDKVIALALKANISHTQFFNRKVESAPETASLVIPITVNNNSSKNIANIKWQWPVKGDIVEVFSNVSKGIDISGALGDKIAAAADGKIVYAGNALPGYGNLIIIKHNDDYLTSYSHNQTILIKELQEVKAGQPIATMGDVGASSVRLHFEIRYQAKSVDPLKYLPPQ